MTGIFTADFMMLKMVLLLETLRCSWTKFCNKARTTDGGKTWKLVAENQGFGYASCVQYILVKENRSVGASGLFYSSDSGLNWKQLAKDPSLYTLRFIDNHTAIAAGKIKWCVSSLK
jgi:hypothetical protein